MLPRKAEPLRGESTHALAEPGGLSLYLPHARAQRQRAGGRVERSAAKASLIRELRLAVALPLGLLLALTVACWYSNVELAISGLFHGEGQQWPLRHREPWHSLYLFGTIPGWVVGVSGVVVWLIGMCLRRIDIAKFGLFCALMLALGPGLIINGIFKPYWNRPRPNQVVQFGGKHAFVPVLGYGHSRLHRSFPCGHASMGFSLMSLAFLLHRRRPGWALFFLLVALFAGLLLGVTRVMQGKHFPSDVLWAWGLVYFTGVALYYALGLRPAAESRHPLTDEQRETTPEPVLLPFPQPDPEIPGADDVDGRSRQRRLANAA